MTNDAHYAPRNESLLRDALIAIRHNQSLTEARRTGHLPLDYHYALASASEMLRTFAEVPAALRNTLAIAERCHVSLDFSQQWMPAFKMPDDLSEFAYLYQLCHAGLARCYPELRLAVLNQLAHELDVIERAQVAASRTALGRSTVTCQTTTRPDAAAGCMSVALMPTS